MVKIPNRGWFPGALLAISIWVVTTQPAAIAQTPESGACTLEPVSIPLFEATPAAVIAATPVAGVPGVDVDEVEIRAAIDVLVACMNSGDAAYRYAIFTERYLAMQLADPSQTYQPEFELNLSLGQTEPEGSLQLVSVDQIMSMENGLVSVVVEISNSVTTFRDTLLLANIGGVWLIDSIARLDPPQ